MRILVTGGNGFIGGHVVNLLLQLGHSPLIFDHMQTASNLRQDVDYLCASISDEYEVMKAVQDSEGVIHLAGVLGTSESIASPKGSVATNVLGSLNVFEACRRFCKKCVYITVGNYWMNNPYSITKTAVERFAWMYNKEHGTKISVVRALNAYGPGQKATPVRKIIPNFILTALQRRPIEVFGDGSQIMDMIYVEDLADILIRALLVEHNSYVDVPRRGTEAKTIFEAGTGRRTTVIGIANLVAYLTRAPEDIRYLQMRGGEPPGSTVVGDPETLRPLYDGNIPKFTELEDGLKKTIDYYRTNLPQAKLEVAF